LHLIKKNPQGAQSKKGRPAKAKGMAFFAYFCSKLNKRASLKTLLFLSNGEELKVRLNK